MQTVPDKKAFNCDVIIIGGSYAGLSAALTLARSLRSVIVIDNGRPSNAPTAHTHNLIGWDGKKTGSLLLAAREELHFYSEVTLIDDTALSASREEQLFTVKTKSGLIVKAAKLLLATGLQDEPVDIAGAKDCWGLSLLQCPYCHGYEFKNRRLGVLASGPDAFNLARLVSQWSAQTILFTNGQSPPAIAQRMKLESRGIDIIEKTIVAFKHTGGNIESVELIDNSSIHIDAVFTKTEVKANHNVLAIAQSLGCEIGEEGFFYAGRIITDASSGRTNIPGLYAAGDNSNLSRSLAESISAGRSIGIHINESLLKEVFC